MNTKLKDNEYILFDKLSNEWWDEDGKFRVLHQIRPIRIKYILDQISQKNVKNLDILDLGCGGGLVSESLSKLGGKVTGIDFIKNNIEVAKLHSAKKNLKINYLFKDIEKIDLKKKYDIIIMFEILEHLKDWENFLSKIKHNLKKNGTIIISTINRNILSKYLAIYFAEYILQWVPIGTHTYEKLIKPEEIEYCMNKNKLRMKDLKGLVFNPISSSWKLSYNTKINYFCSFTYIS